jgi:hypothetical protein
MPFVLVTLSLHGVSYRKLAMKHLPKEHTEGKYVYWLSVWLAEKIFRGLTVHLKQV